MDEELIERLDEVAKTNHRKRGPEVNVAVEFYLKYQGVDIDALKRDSQDIQNKDNINDSSKGIVEDVQEETTEVIMGNFGFDK